MRSGSAVLRFLPCPSPSRAQIFAHALCYESCILLFSVSFGRGPPLWRGVLCVYSGQAMELPMTRVLLQLPLLWMQSFCASTFGC
jgi:hypothetical protein